MNADDELAEQFEHHRARLRAIAGRILGSPGDADDAVQETWLRLNRADAATIENLGGWLTTVVARVSLNVLRSREARREELFEQIPDPVVSPVDDPQSAAELADGVGIALQVVLATLSPSERVAFVLHDLFAVPFDEIATLLERTPEAARQLASRGRRRVRGGTAGADGDGDHLHRQEVVDAFLAASRDGDLAALIAVLDPDVVRRADLGPGKVDVVRGAAAVAAQAQRYSQDFELDQRRALVNGAPGLVTFRNGQPFSVMVFDVAGDVIVAIDILVDRRRLLALDLTAVS